MTLWIIIVYLLLVLAFGIFCSRLVGRTAEAYFLAGRGIGSFMLLMSIFGTTMTAFALIGSTGKTFEVGIGVYGLIASWAGIVHVAMAGVLSVAALWIYFLPEVLDPGREGEFLLFDLQIMPVTLIVAISSIFVSVGSLVTPKPAPELVERFFPNAGLGVTKSEISLGQ